MISGLNPPQLDTVPLQNLYDFLKPVIVPSTSPEAKFTNWAKTFVCKPLAVFEPTDEFQCEVILAIARREGKVVRAVGVGHSPSDLACTNEFMLRTRHLNRVLSVDFEKRRVVAQGGITLNDLHARLDEHGLAMINVGSISDQTLAGIVTTATHGTGIHYGVMSTHVLSLTLLLADGSRVNCSRYERPDLFIASICGLGSTGLILNIELEVEPAFRLREETYSRPFEDIVSKIDAVARSAEHARLYWFPAADSVRVSLLNRTHEEKTSNGSWVWDSMIGHHVLQMMLFIGRYFGIFNLWATHLAAWLVSADSIGVDDGYTKFNLDCRYLQYTTEWAIPYENTEACLRELHHYFREENADPEGARTHFPIEVRFSAPDDIWLSPSNGCQTCWIGIVQYKPYGFSVPYRKLFDGFEKILARHQGRPHWAKAHPLLPEDLRKLYPDFDKFIQVLEQVDPSGVFRSEYIQRHFMGKLVDRRAFKARRT
ncbi:gulonolactone oxidase Lgo1 [Dendrothele bispora CBS 962.96]|uniref:D-arabinono-1,4-lactone oxidase n=1 Tax=Dendrothele bispora (strain CBS 962.96) TaxID=1314807 RepID=A0A4S8LW50_DENBC|nr:gulonolactone oxidase Lgo1 [Dendrothele bispora CBS 962.96]